MPTHYNIRIQDLARDTCLFCRDNVTTWPGLPRLADIRTTAAHWPDAFPADVSQPVMRAVLSVQTARGAAVERKSWLGFLSGDGAALAIRWEEGPGLMPPRIDISADLDGFGAWDEHGQALSLADEFPDEPKMVQLAADLFAWAWPYDKAYAACHFVKHNMQMDWDRFNAEGRALAVRLKAIVGSKAVIFYTKSSWDATRSTDATTFVD